MALTQNDRRVATDVDARTFDALAKRAKQNERTISAELRVAIRSHLDKPKLAA